MTTAHNVVSSMITYLLPPSTAATMSKAKQDYTCSAKTNILITVSCVFVEPSITKSQLWERLTTMGHTHQLTMLHTLCYHNLPIWHCHNTTPTPSLLDSPPPVSILVTFKFTHTAKKNCGVKLYIVSCVFKGYPIIVHALVESLGTGLCTCSLGTGLSTCRYLAHTPLFS